MLKRIGLFSLFLAFCFSISVIGALPTYAQPTGGLGGRPANPNPDNPRSQSIFIHTIDKGESREDAILVSNNSNESKVIDVYPVDGLVTNTGAYTCRQKTEPKVGAGDWVQMRQSKVELAPNSSKEIDFAITVPENADVGEHNGCIVLEPTDSTSDSSSGVRIRTRQAIRLAITIPGDLHRDISIKEFLFSQKSDKDGRYYQQFNLKLENMGNVSADVNSNVRLSNMFGKTIYENGGSYPVLSNEKLDLTFANQERPTFGGLYFAQASISYDERAGSFGVSNKSHLVHQDTDKEIVFIAPTLKGLSIILLALVSIVLIVLAYINRRKPKYSKRR